MDKYHLSVDHQCLNNHYHMDIKHPIFKLHTILILIIKVHTILMIIVRIRFFKYIINRYTLKFDF